MKRVLLLLGLTGLLLLAAANAQAEVRTEENNVWYRFHFGMGVGSAAVSADKFTVFMDTEVTPRFPAGFTVTVGRGQWRSPKGGVIKERTVMVDVQCPDTEENRQKMESVAQAYVRQFGKAKSSVFVVRVPGVTTQLWYE